MDRGNPVPWILATPTIGVSLRRRIKGLPGLFQFACREGRLVAGSISKLSLAWKCLAIHGQDGNAINQRSLTFRLTSGSWLFGVGPGWPRAENK